MISYPCKLTRALEEFVKRYPEYSTPDGAHDKCFMASIEFQEVMFEFGLIDEDGRETLWDVVEVAVTPYMSLDVNTKYKTHWVFLWSTTLIDVTSRQFDEALPYPTVVPLEQCILK